MSDVLLGVNIDHVATLRQARGTRYPEPVYAALVAEEHGADGITVHPREDARHIQLRDVRLLSQLLQTRMNLEMAVTEVMLCFAEEIKPANICLVPEKREELTTEGGLDIIAGFDRVQAACQRLGRQGMDVSLFIDPEPAQIDAAIRAGAPTIELHTGAYADAQTPAQVALELKRIRDAAEYAAGKVVVNAGHGLHYHNTQAIAAISVFHELNIGHALISHALFSGLGNAVREMKTLMQNARRDALLAELAAR